MRKLAIALAVIAAIGVPAAHATPESWWLVSTKNWTCLSAPEAEFIAKTPDGSPRAMEQTIYQRDGSVAPLFWFAARVDCESWLAQLRQKGLAKLNPASRVP